jgi:hypothetical protein
VWVGLPLSDQSASPRETMKHPQIRWNATGEHFCMNCGANI